MSASQGKTYHAHDHENAYSSLARESETPLSKPLIAGFVQHLSDVYGEICCGLRNWLWMRMTLTSRS